MSTHRPPSSVLPGAEELRERAERAAHACGADLTAYPGDHEGRSPITGTVLSSLAWSDAAGVREAVARAAEAFRAWRSVPAPARGAVVKRFAELLTEHRDDLATLVSLEAGKVTSEARGEVQEMIDICDYAVGLSRQLFGRTMASERPGHRLAETWHPLGVVGVVSAFNFPVAVWSWNTAVALVCGDPVVWKPSERTPLCALAANALLVRALQEGGYDASLSQVVLGGPEVGEALAVDAGVALLSATGSTRMGRQVGPVVAERFGRSLLELGGNNAAVVAPSADLDLAVRGIVFAAAGTAGQRCTTMRRAIVHRSVVDELTARVADAYRRLPVGDPTADGTLVGPLLDGRAYEAFTGALDKATAAGGEVVAGGGRELAEAVPDAYYVRPAVVRMPSQTEVVHAETFAPILYVLAYDDLEEAIELNNAVPQGCPRASSRRTRRRRRSSARRWAPTAASSTSTSARPVPRSAGPSAGRRRPGEGASRARTPGGPTCGGSRPRSTSPGSCRSRRASGSTSECTGVRSAGHWRRSPAFTVRSTP